MCPGPFYIVSGPRCPSERPTGACPHMHVSGLPPPCRPFYTSAARKYIALRREPTLSTTTVRLLKECLERRRQQRVARLLSRGRTTPK
eukprot:583126-Prymnesium_polylepis.1